MHRAWPSFQAGSKMKQEHLEVGGKLRHKARTGHTWVTYLQLRIARPAEVVTRPIGQFQRTGKHHWGLDGNFHRSMVYQDRRTFHEELVLQHIVAHVLNSNGACLYRFYSYGYFPDEDTWEPVEPLPRLKVIQYHCRTRYSLPSTLDRAQAG